MSALPLLVRSREDVWGTTSESPSSALDSQSSPPADVPSRQFPVSSFSTVRVEAQDYWEYHRILDSIEARLQKLKRDPRLAPLRAVASREGG